MTLYIFRYIYFIQPNFIKHILLGLQVRRLDGEVGRRFEPPTFENIFIFLITFIVCQNVTNVINQIIYSDHVNQPSQCLTVSIRRYISVGSVIFMKYMRELNSKFGLIISGSPETNGNRGSVYVSRPNEIYILKPNFWKTKRYKFITDTTHDFPSSTIDNDPYSGPTTTPQWKSMPRCQELPYAR